MIQTKAARTIMLSIFMAWTQIGLSITPEESLQRLMEGNGRYVQDKLLYPNVSAARREAISAKQEPFAIILGCSDSRVPPEIVFDQGVGDLFVVRVAGNVVGPIELDSIEYATKYLHSSLIVVLGHEQCGAMKAVLAGETADIEAVANRIKPIIEKCQKECKEGCESDQKSLTDLCTQANIKYIVRKLKRSPLIAKYIEENKVNVVSGFYDLNTGKVEILSR